MRKTTRIELRITPERKALWEAAALAAGTSLTQYIENCVDDDQGEVTMPGSPTLTETVLYGGRNIVSEQAIVRPGKPATLHLPLNPEKKSVRARTGLCVHRRPADAFCPRCD